MDGQHKFIDCHVGSLTDEASMRLARTYKLAAVQQGKLAPFFGERLIVPELRPEVAQVQDTLLAGPREARRKFKEKLGPSTSEYSLQLLTFLLLSDATPERSEALILPLFAIHISLILNGQGIPLA